MSRLETLGRGYRATMNESEQGSGKKALQAFVSVPLVILVGLAALVVVYLVVR